MIDDRVFIVILIGAMLICFALGAMIGTGDKTQEMQKKMIELECGKYNETTGEFEYIEPEENND